MTEPAPHPIDAPLPAVLFPTEVASWLSWRLPPEATLLTMESAAAAAFAPGRRAEFTHGRSCARQALHQLGLEAGGIPVGASREPLWPTGIVGSISHAGTAATAGVARAGGNIVNLGLDLEPDEPLDAELVAQVCRPTEIARLAISDADPARAARHVFAMKEAVYKALWPVQRRFLEFHDVEVHGGSGRGTFGVTIHNGRCPPETAARLEGRFARIGTMFVAGVVLGK